MTSDVSLCSSALMLLGEAPITTLTGALKNQKLCNQLYPQIRDRLLRRHQPTCARKRELISADATAPSFDWSARFLIPPDCLRILQVGEDGARESYEIEGRYILADLTTLPLVYVYRNTDAQSYDSAFADLLTATLAAALAYPITKSATLREAMATEAKRLALEVGSVGGQEQEPEDLPDSSLITTRF